MDVVAPQAFVSALRTILRDNWTLDVRGWKPDEPLELLSRDDGALRAALARGFEGVWPDALLEGLSRAHMDRYRSGFLAAHAFALHLLRVDEDNWFDFAGARAACAWFEEPLKQRERRELVLLKGLSAALLLPGMIVPPDLPVILDHGSGAAFVVMAGLAD